MMFLSTIHLTCNPPYLQSALHAIRLTCNPPYVQSDFTCNPPYVQSDFTCNPGPTDFSTILPNWAYVNCHLSKCLSSHIDSEHSVAEVSPNLPL